MVQETMNDEKRWLVDNLSHLNVTPSFRGKKIVPENR